MSTEIVHKAEGSVITAEIGDIVLEKAGIVKLKIGPELVERFERVGDDLQLVLKDGRTITIHNFFVVDEEGERSDLVLEDRDEVLWWGQYTSPWAEFHFTEIHDDPVAVALLPWGGLPAWAGLALAVIGGGLALGRFGSDDSSSTPPPPPPPSPANSAPSAPDYSHVVDEDASISGRVQGSDPDGDPLTYTLDTPPTNGTVVVNPDGSYTYTPDPDYNGPDAFTVTVDDGNGGTTTSTVVIEVTPVNDPPVAIPPAAPLDQSSEDGNSVSVTLDLPGLFTDVDGDTLTYTITGLPPGLSFDPATGIISGTIDTSASVGGPYTVTVTADDGNGGTAGQTFTWTVTNPAPTATDNSNTIAEDATSPATGNLLTDDDGDGADSDPDGDDLTVTGVTGGDVYGSLTWDADGGYSYAIDNANPAVQALAEGETLTETYTYTIDDGEGGTDTATLTITITGTNDIPVAVADTATIAEDTVDVSGNVRDNDTDGDGTPAENSASLNGSATGSYGSIVLNADGSYTYTLDNGNPAVQALADGETLTEIYSYTLTDKDGDTSTTTLTITIIGTNDAPVAVGSIGPQANEDAEAITSLDVTPFFDDVDASDTLTYTASGLPPGLSIDRDTGLISGTIDNSASVDGPYTVTVTANDGNGGTAEQTFTWTVTNPAPTATDNSNTIAEGATSPATGNVLTDDDGDGADSDPDGDDLTVTGVTGGDVYGSLTWGEDGSYSYVIDNTNPVVQALTDGETLTETYTYTIDDGEGGTDTATLTITITGTNDDPVIVGGAQTGTVVEAGHEDDGTAVPGTPSAAGQFTATDVDNDPADLVWSIVGTADDTYGSFTLDVATGQWTYTLDNNLPATQALNEGDLVELEFTVRVSDGAGGTADQTVIITVTGTNDAPVAVADTDSVKEQGVQDGGNTSEAGTPEATGNVLSNDTDVDEGETASLEVTLVSFDGGTAVAAGTLVAGQYGDLTLNADGSYTYTLDNARTATQELAQGQSGTEVFTYTIADVNGAVSTSTLTITVEGTNDQPVITSEAADAAGSVTEQGTANPTEPDTASGTLVASDVDAGATQTWSIEGTDDGTYGTIAIDPATGEWTYTLDNTRDATQALNDGEVGTETFTARVTDEHGAYSEQVITVTVNGSNDDLTGEGPQTLTLLEDNVLTGTVQDYVNDVDDTIVVTGFGIGASNIAPGDTLTLTTGDGSYIGAVVINADGSFTFTPATHYSGEVPTITYTVQEQGPGGKSLTQTLTFEITPVSDAPGLPVVDATLTTNEDTSIALGLLKPVITDNTDLNGTGDGDNPERIGAITLTLQNADGSGPAPGGTTLTMADGTELELNAQGGYTIVIVTTSGGTVDTSLHVSSGLPSTAVNYLTQAEYEALLARPADENHANFRVVVEATSYEVDDGGTQLADVPGATATQVIDIGVQAVTDPVDLRINGSDAPHTVTVAEDATLNLKDYLSVVLPADTDGRPGHDVDGSQNHWFEITGLPVGTEINGTTITSTTQVVTVQAPGLSTDPTSGAGLPDISITLPGDFSGNINDISITLKVQDIDDDGPDNGAVLEDTVTLNLVVTPVAGDVVAGAVSTEEDTAVAFLANVQVTDTGTSAGTEVIDSIAFTVPADWVLTTIPSVAGMTVTGGPTGPVTIAFTDMAQADIEAALAGFEITPPPHSSLDVEIPLTIVTTDTNTTGSDTVTSTLTLAITVTPVAEQVGSDSDGDSSDDVTMTGGHEYTGGGAEDTWYRLGTDGAFDLAAGWSNADDASNGGREQTYAQLTPELVSGAAGESALGSTFRYNDGNGLVEVPYTGPDSVRIPVEFLDTLEFLPPEHVSGTFRIKVEAYTEDFDDDGGDTPVSATSGEAWLDNIIIDPVPDQVTLSVDGRLTTLEDTPVTLRIRPSSDDPGETFNVTIRGIPAGASILYGGVTYDTTGSPLPGELTEEADGSFTLRLVDFDAGTPPVFTPPLDSNAPINLTVEAQSVDGSVSGGTTTLPIRITVKGVADTPVLEVDSPQYNEATLDDNGNTVELRDLITNLASGEAVDGDGNTDGSEIVTLRITGLPDGVTLIGAGHVLGADSTGTDRVWVATPAQIADGSVKIVLPPNYSGTMEFTVQPVVTESDNPSQTFPARDVSFTVTPSPEATLNVTSQIVEDAIGRLDLSATHQNGDSDEIISLVRFRVADGEAPVAFFQDAGGTIALVPDGDGWYTVTGVTDLASVYAKAGPNFSGEVRLEVEYVVTDPSQDGTLPAVDSAPQTGTHTLVIGAVTDEATAAIDSIDAPTGTATGSAVELDAAGTVTVNITIGKAADPLAGGASDHDGSEALTHIVVRGVPDGVVVQGATMVGDGEWLLVTTDTFTDAGGIQKPIVFEVSGNAGGLVGAPITITAYTQDLGQLGTGTAAELVETAEVTWTLGTDFTPGGGDALPEVTLQTIDAPQTEDVGFTLGSVVGGAIDASSANIDDYAITITLRSTPGDGMHFGPGMTPVEVIENGVPVILWSRTVQVTGGDEPEAVLQDALDGIFVTTAPDANGNANNLGGPLVLDVTVTLHGNGLTNSDRVEPQVDIAPVTDPATVSIVAAPGAEGQPIDITVTVGNDGDGSGDWSIIDGRLYLQTDGAIDGELAHDGTPLATVTDPAGLPAGTYYVVDGVAPDTAVNITFTPLNPYDNGELQLTGWVRNEETGGDPVVSTGSQTLTIEPTNTEPDITVTTGAGTEHDGLTPSLVEVEVTGTALPDADESLQAIFISGLPSGFAVYHGADAGTATQASNAGGNGTGNTWSIPVASGGGLPAYIGIQAPAHWSGSLTDLTLYLVGGESGNEPTAWPFGFDLTVAPNADGLTLTPTLSFGTAEQGTPIALNLNASMIDNEAAGPGDRHYELATLALSGFPAPDDAVDVEFYIGGTLLALDGASPAGSMAELTYEAGSYVISGLTQAELDQLGFNYRNGGSGGRQSIEVEAWTREYDVDTGAPAGDPSARQNATVDINVAEPPAGFSDGTGSDLAFLSGWGEEALANLEAVAGKAGAFAASSVAAVALYDLDWPMPNPTALQDLTPAQVGEILGGSGDGAGGIPGMGAGGGAWTPADPADALPSLAGSGGTPDALPAEIGGIGLTPIPLPVSNPLDDSDQPFLSVV